MVCDEGSYFFSHLHPFSSPMDSNKSGWITVKKIYLNFRGSNHENLLLQPIRIHVFLTDFLFMFSHFRSESTFIIIHSPNKWRYSVLLQCFIYYIILYDKSRDEGANLNEIRLNFYNMFINHLFAACIRCDAGQVDKPRNKKWRHVFE